MSYADERLFCDLLTQIGGIGFAEHVMFPHVKSREVVNIEAIVPYDNRKTGVERWTIKHDDQEICSYLVRFIPDGQGGTTFSVKKDRGTKQ